MKRLLAGSPDRTLADQLQAEAGSFAPLRCDHGFRRGHPRLPRKAQAPRLPAGEAIPTAVH
ncbi:MAG: hypothetical protein MZW92_13345 [Comamonadaceae bacterium]|nr:hypothetical protein [Comamonadaceae bacterium]